MRFLGLDLETTGIDFNTCEILEVGVVLQDTPLLTSKPLIQLSDLCLISGKISEEIYKLTKIDDNMVSEFGKPVAQIIANVEEICRRYQPDYIVAHNGEIFDKPWIFHHAKENGVDITRLQSIPWIDTAADIPEDKFGTRKLTYMAAECGFLNPGAHSALDDVKTMMRVLGHCDIDYIVKRAAEPWVVVRAFTDYPQRELAKAAKFSWQECGGKTYDKQWVKRMKKSDFDAFQKTAPFKCAIIG